MTARAERWEQASGLPASEGLRSALLGTGLAGAEGAVVSTDLFYGPRTAKRAGWRRGAGGGDGAATLFTLAARRGAEAGCALIV